MPVVVRLAEAVPVTGGLMLELLEVDGKAMSSGGSGGRGGPVRRRAAKAKRKSDKAKRKGLRKRK